MAKRIFAPGVLALLLAMQPQVGAAGNGNDSDGCTLLANAAKPSILYAAGESLTPTGLRKNGKRLPNGAMTVDKPANCNYATTIEATAASRVSQGVPLNSGLMTYL